MIVFQLQNLLKFIKQPLMVKVFIIFTAIFMSSLIFFFLRWSKLPPEVPLYYSLPWGEKQLASPWELTILPTLALSIMVTNFFLAFFFAQDNKLLLKILIYTSLFVSIILLYNFIQIIILVS